LIILNIFLFGFGVWQNLFIKNPSKTNFFEFPPKTIVNKNIPLPKLSTDYYLVIDVANNSVLLESKSLDRIYPASLTKLATALTALNLYPLDEVITAKSYSEGKVMELQDGEKVTIRTLVSALLIYSANDAAFNLANHYQQSEAGFVEEMNKLAAKYQLTNTHFTNYDGIHNSSHYSTLYDLSQLARLSLNLPVITEAVKTKELTLFDVDNKISHQLVSTNELLGKIPELKGLKTGWTPEAGGCFIGLVDFNGHQIITLVAQSVDRFTDTENIINWARQSLSWQYQTY
jgi:D-alanyl-D-alanine carboxypeptidase (penicillin-binding protein 5/6)